MKRTAIARVNLFLQRYNVSSTLVCFSDSNLEMEIDHGDFGDSPVTYLAMNEADNTWKISLRLDDGEEVSLEDYMKHHTYQSRTNYLYS